MLSSKKNLLLIAVTVTIVILGGLFSYHIVTKNKSNGVINLTDKEFLHPFYIENSPDYKKAYALYDQGIDEFREQSSIGQLYKETLTKAIVQFATIAEDSSKPPRERAFAYNMLNIIYITSNWNVEIFETALTQIPNLKTVFEKNTTAVLATLVSDSNDPGRNNRSAVKSIALQQTILHTNNLSNALYQNSYAYLRSHLNEIQIIGKITDNSLNSLRKEKIEGSFPFKTYARNKYTENDLLEILKKSDEFRNRGTFYEGTGSLGFQIHMMRSAIYDVLTTVATSTESSRKYTELSLKEYVDALTFIDSRGVGVRKIDHTMTQMFYIAALVNASNDRQTDEQKKKTYYSAAVKEAKKMISYADTDQATMSYLQLNESSSYAPQSVIDSGKYLSFFGRVPFYQLRLLATKMSITDKDDSLKNFLETKAFWKFSFRQP